MYYKRIKGVGGATQVPNSNSGYFTYIYFMDKSYNGSSEEKKWEDFKDTARHISHSPSIEFSKLGDKYDDNIEHLGHIITTECKEGFITNDFTFKSNLIVKNNLTIKKTLTFSEFTTNPHTIIAEDNQFKFNKTIDITGSITALSKLTIKGGGATITGNTSVVDGTFHSSGKLSSGTYIEAPYFNAQSDRRAKTNIEQASFNALQAVKNLSIYTFNYKDTNLPSLGVIAQDAAQIDFGTDFNLVNNLEASGENGDYMTIKESKMVYVLWKAVQEQQEIIDALKTEINNLKDKRS